jgi:hypothetical protein
MELEHTEDWWQVGAVARAVRTHASSPLPGRQLVASADASNRNQIRQLVRRVFLRRLGRRRCLLLAQSQEFTHGVSGDKDSAADMHSPKIAPPNQFICQASRHADGLGGLTHCIR